MFDNYDKYYNKAISLKSETELLKTQYTNTLLKKENTSKELKDLIKKEHNYELAVDLMKKLVEGLSQSQIRHLEELINSALETIFFDRQYFIELQITELRNTNNLHIILNEVNEQGELIKTKIDDNGGGIKCIVGFILNVFYILYHKQYPILFMDESFTNLSKQYLPYIKSLINSLSDKYGFIFVLVTHDTELMNLADRTYLVDKGNVKLYNVIGG